MGSNGQLTAGASSSGSSDFVRKLYKMLESPSDENIVRWGNDGDSFVVLENETFTKQILPKHFKHSNFASFVRQLNKYDFHKVRHSNEEGVHSPYGSGAWEFKHPDFRINNKDALDNIRRKAPATRKPTSIVSEDGVLPGQVEQLQSELVTTKTQLRQTQEQYTELSVQYSMMLMDMVNLQKTVTGHDQVLRSVVQSLQILLQQSGMSLPNLDLSLNPHPGSSSSSTVNPDIPGPSATDGLIQQSENAKNVLSNRSLGSLNSTQLIDGKTAQVFPLQMQQDSGQNGQNAGPPVPGEVTMAGAVDPMGFSVTQQGGEVVIFNTTGNNPHVGALAAVRTPSQSEGKMRRPVPMECNWVREPRILLVEDDPACKRIGQKFLLSYSCEVQLANDGLEALNAINTGTFDLVLMDIIMPNLDGVSTCSVIRNFHSTPIIAMTSNVRNEDIAHYYKSGMNDVLAKPFTKDGLYTILHKHLSHLRIGSRPHPSIQPSLMAPQPEDGQGAHSSHNSAWNSPIPMTVVPGVMAPQDTFAHPSQVPAAVSQGVQPPPPPSQQQQQHQQHQQHQQQQQQMAQAHSSFGAMNPAFPPQQAGLAGSQPMVPPQTIPIHAARMTH